MNIAKITLPSDRNAGGIQDITNLVKKIETNLNLQAQQIQALQPAVRVITANSVWLPTDRLIVIDTTAGNVTYTISSPADAIANGFVGLSVKWWTNANVAKIVTADGSFIDGFASITIASQYDVVNLMPSLIAGYFGWIRS